MSGFYLGFIVWGRSPEWPKVTSFLGGVGGMLPRESFGNEYALACNLVHFEIQFSEMLQWYFILFFSHDHVLTMLHLAPIFAKGPVIIYVGGGGGGEIMGGGPDPIFSKTRGGPKENFTMIGGWSLCDWRMSLQCGRFNSNTMQCDKWQTNLYRESKLCALNIVIVQHPFNSVLNDCKCIHGKESLIQEVDVE